MRVFITGGTGFVGKHTVEELQKHGHQVLILSRKNPKTIFSSRRNLAFLRGDLSDIKKWQKKLAVWKPEVAFHLAWESLPDHGFEMSSKNLLQGIELVRVLSKVGCKKVVAAGSCWEYGRTSGKMSEEIDPRLTDAFSVAKVALCWLGKEAAKLSGMEFVWARIFYVYGPGQKASSLIPYLINEKLRGALPDVKNPNGGNDFIYVDDVARALRLLIEKKTPHVIYNIGSGHITGVREIVRVVYGKDVIKRKGRAEGFYADIRKIKKDIGWRPVTGIGMGVREMMRAES